jgi:predicted enzyme related to lactoylglutathione lyase
MPRVTHFELPADDPERALAFYKSVFGWEAEKWQGDFPYWMLRTGDGYGIDGAVMARLPAMSGPINSIAVPSVDAYVAKVVANGGSVVRPKEQVPGIGFYAYVSDTEGTVFSLMEFLEELR